MMDVSESIAFAMAGAIVALIFGAIFAAIVHFVLGDNIWSTLIMYLIIAIIPSLIGDSTVERSTKVVGALIAVAIAFLVMTYVFPMIFGPYIGFPYSMLDLGPMMTGLIISLIVGLLAAVTTS
jgi:hypothetical protein